MKRIPALVGAGAALVAALSCGPGSDPPAVDPDLAESIGWYTGVGGEVSNERAKMLLERAAEDGDPLSVMWIARVHSRGRMGFAEDSARAREMAAGVIAQVERLAGRGIAEANFLMGTAYAEGLGKPVDAVEAVRWYRRAAEMGHVLAQHNMGNVYAEGLGVEPNDSLAVVWWSRAAEQGDAIPQFRLGTMYEEGRGVERDLAAARRWYEESARRGEPRARAALERLDGR